MSRIRFTAMGMTVPTFAALLLIAVSCASKAPASPELGSAANDSGALDASGAVDGTADASTSGMFFTGDSAVVTDSSPPAPCHNAADVDGDHDGFTGAQGDCNDCDPNINPAAYDVPGNGLDEDCSGKADDEPTGCDTGLAIDSSHPLDAAKALGLCRMQTGKSWGVLSAAWVLPDGAKTTNKALAGCTLNAPPNPLSHGLLSSFGAQAMPRDGASMVVISSGIARSGPNDVPPPGSGQSPVNGSMCTESAPPPGFPKDSPACPGVVAKGGTVYDGVALELQIKVPSNATGMSFDFNFFTTEFPNYVCSPDGYNDQFVSLLWSTASGTPADHNISFDSMGNGVNVNSGFLDACVPVTLGSRSFPCTLGKGMLEGTGMLAVLSGPNGMYTQGGATGWLTTKAKVTPAETITLRLAIWDAGDSQWDSTTLIDRFVWTVSSGQAATPSAAPVTNRPPR